MSFVKHISVAVCESVDADDIFDTEDISIDNVIDYINLHTLSQICESIIEDVPAEHDQDQFVEKFYETDEVADVDGETMDLDTLVEDVDMNFGETDQNIDPKTDESVDSWLIQVAPCTPKAIIIDDAE